MTATNSPAEKFQGFLLQCPPGLAKNLTREILFHKIVPFKDRVLVKFQRNHDLLFIYSADNIKGFSKLRLADRVLDVPAYGKFKISKSHLDAIAKSLKKRDQPARLVVTSTGDHFQRQDLHRWMMKEMEERGYEFSLEEEDSEVWLITIDELFYFGLPIFRASDASFRNKRSLERDGALPSALAAALAFSARPLPGEKVWDPCVGSGTLLAEAFAYSPESDFFGHDIDPEAIEIAKTNLSHLPKINLQNRSHAKTDFADGSIHCVISNLPFGKKYGTEDSNLATYRQFLTELKRVAEPKKFRGIVLTSDVEALSEALKQTPGFASELLFKCKTKGLEAQAFKLTLKK